MTSAKALKAAVFDQVADYSRRLQEQGEVDLAGLEEGVRAYCEAVATLPKEEGQKHSQDLQELMNAIASLGDALASAREEVQRELAGLGKLRHANVAYKKSDAIGPVVRPREEDEP